jgi:hypothetical protein
LPLADGRERFHLRDIVPFLQDEISDMKTVREQNQMAGARNASTSRQQARAHFLLRGGRDPPARIPTVWPAGATTV